IFRSSASAQLIQIVGFSVSEVASPPLGGQRMTPPSTGPYADIVYSQSRDNTMTASFIPYATLLEEIASRRTVAVDHAAFRVGEVLLAGGVALRGGPRSAMTTQATQRQRSEADRPGNGPEELEMRLSDGSHAKAQAPGTRGKRSDLSILDKLFATMGGLDNPL